MTTIARLLLPHLCSVLLFVQLRAQVQEESLPQITPRPSAIAGVSTPLMSLNGIWMFQPEYQGAVYDSIADQANGWSPITVPGEWVMQSYVVRPGIFAGYSRMFNVPGDWAGKTIKLRFDGVHSVCRVWVNSAWVGEHVGGFTVFEFDVTKLIKTGSNNITVAVQSESVADTLASASQYAAHPLGGITRKVTLFAVPEVHIASLATRTVFDKNFKNADLIVDFDLAGNFTLSGGLPKFAVELFNPSGQQEITEPATITPGTAAPGMTRPYSFSIRIPNVKKWDPEHPNLYSLRLQMWQDGRPVETLVQRIGFRQVATRGNRVFVNGQAIKLHGVNRHEVHPTLGRSLTSEFWRKDAELFRAANVNYIRTSHYPPAEEFMDACDELGLFVECEAALCWVQHPANETWKEWDYRDKKFFPYLLRANLENVAANRHHPSVIIWSLANESYWSPSFARVLEAVRRADPSRLTSFHDQCWGKYNNGGSKAQLAVYHYPDEKSPEQCNRESRPVLFGEYTHIECYNRKEGVTDPGIRDRWGGPFQRMYDLVYRNPGCLGGAIWAGIDEIFLLPDGQVCGYGPWGIIDAWRRPKPEYWHVKKSYSPIRVILPGSALRVVDGAINIRLENRYDFTNLREVAITWSLGKETGKTSVDVKPHEKGLLAIRTRQMPVAGKMLRLTFADPRGFVCETEELFLGPQKPALEASEEPTPAAKLDSTEQQYVIRGRDYICNVDRKSGKITQTLMKGADLLIGGPELMILPLHAGECAPNYRSDFPALNSTCAGWQQKSIQASVLKDGAVRILSTGDYTEAQGYSILTFRGDGEILLEYSFHVLQDIDPRQWGMVLFAPAEMDSLSWQRQGQWSTYPPDHIGRLSGSAVASPRSRDIASASRVPGGGWSSDANELGSNDFRSTKSKFIVGSLLSREGYGLSPRAEGVKAMRAFVDGKRIGLLVAGFNTGGADPFFAPHYAGERKPLKKGDVIADKFTVRFISR